MQEMSPQSVAASISYLHNEAVNLSVGNPPHQTANVHSNFHLPYRGNAVQSTNSLHAEESHSAGDKTSRHGAKCPSHSQGFQPPSKPLKEKAHSISGTHLYMGLHE